MDIDHSPPISAGASSDTADQAGETTARLRLTSLSRQQVRAETWPADVPVRVEEPAHVCVAEAFGQRLPVRAETAHGRVGGSPSLSLYLWCRRWSATQTSTGPLDGQGAGDGQRDLQTPVRLERRVG